MVADKIKYRTGTMVKSVWNMTDAEYKIWNENSKNEVKKYLFSIGQPLVYFIDNKAVAEYSDGSIEYIK
jgi:hypothetical protein